MFTKKTAAIAAALGLSSVVVLLGISGAAIPSPAALTSTLASTCTTDNSGYCTVPHDLGAVPSTVLLTPTINPGATPYALSTVAGQSTATTVRVRAIRVSTGAALANTAISFSMLVSGPASPPPTTTTSATTTTSTTTTTTAPVTTTTSPPPSGCALPAYPDASCTGVPPGTRLTAMPGDFTVTAPNTVIDGKDISGCVTVHASGVVIRNSRIACAGFYAVDSYGYTGTGLVIEDSEVHCNNSNGTAIGEENVTATRLNIHGCENGFDIDRTFTVEDSYIHDLYQSAVAHTDGVQLWSTVVGVTIRHNRIYANNGTSAIISPSAGTVDVLIQDNLLAGGAFTLYCRQGGAGTNYRVINNHFSTIFYPTVGAYGPWTDCEDEAQVTGNVYHETGQPVAF